MNRRDTWNHALETLTFAFQPIVNIHTGICLGYEALVRNWKQAGFSSIQDIFDRAEREDILVSIDLELRKNAIRQYCMLAQTQGKTLFLNVDNRVLVTGNTFEEDTVDMALESGLDPSAIVLELSEKHPLPFGHRHSLQLDAHAREGFKLALDDFGTGYSGLQVLYAAEPEFIKIDRFYISEICSDSKKKLFVSHIVNLAHMLGVLVVAEGVETIKEYYCCKEVGCDLVQGYFVAHPTTNYDELRAAYPAIDVLNKKDRRDKVSNRRILLENMENPPAINIDSNMLEVFEMFRLHKECVFFPVVNARNEPVGLVHESQLKKFVYSLYGKDLLANKSLRHLLPKLISKCPIADSKTPPEQILEIFSRADDCEGVIIVQDLKYAGFLSTKSLVRVIHETNIAAARDQNPLTRLAGNYMIYDYISNALQSDKSHILVYFDFDYFKPFNDTYGFRNGDRAIVLFSELLKRDFMRSTCFLGHIGGDDFFIGLQEMNFKEALSSIRTLQETFRRDVEGFYSPKDRTNGWMEAQGRDGRIQRFPMLRVSAAVLCLNAQQHNLTIDNLNTIITDLKKRAKHAADGMATLSYEVVLSGHNAMETEQMLSKVNF